jgi:hypothetical protein
MGADPESLIRAAFPREIDPLCGFSEAELQAAAADCLARLMNLKARWSRQKAAADRLRRKLRAAFDDLDTIGREYRRECDWRQAILAEDGKRRAFVVFEECGPSEGREG